MKMNEALNIKTEKRMAAMEEAQKKRFELHSRIPRIKEIDNIIAAIPFRMLSGESKEALKAETESLNKERERLLEATGYGRDYDDPKFECKVCNDSGYYDGLKVCDCIKKMLSKGNYAESALAKGLQGKTFENFTLSYYAEGDERKAMEGILKGCRRYAENFPNDSSSGLLFLGGTGLGKTHISAAIAGIVAGKGMSVIYESAQQIFDTCEAVRFNRMDVSERRKYDNCALLIIDDLGAECISQYSISSITSLIDLRIVNGKSTIISSNLSLDAIRKTYGERLFSRLLGEFRVLKFMGKDIRMQKINEKR